MSPRYVMLCLGQPDYPDDYRPLSLGEWASPEGARRWLTESCGPLDQHAECSRALAVFEGSTFVRFEWRDNYGAIQLIPPMERRDGRLLPPSLSRQPKIRWGELASDRMWQRLWRFVQSAPAQSCERCPTGHPDPRFEPWRVQRLVDATHPAGRLLITKSSGGHASEADAAWLQALLDDRRLP